MTTITERISALRRTGWHDQPQNGVYVSDLHQILDILDAVVKELEGWRKAASPVTDNPQEDAFYEKAEGLLPKRQRLRYQGP